MVLTLAKHILHSRFQLSFCYRAAWLQSISGRWMPMYCYFFYEEENVKFTEEYSLRKANGIRKDNVHSQYFGNQVPAAGFIKISAQSFQLRSGHMTFQVSIRAARCTKCNSFSPGAQEIQVYCCCSYACKDIINIINTIYLIVFCLLKIPFMENT